MQLTEDIATQWWLESLEAPLEAARQKELEHYLDNNPALKEELAQQSHLWKSMEQLQSPEPSQEMDMAFATMLRQAAGEAKQPSVFEQLREWVAIHWATSLGSLAMGVVLGVFFMPRQANDVSKLTEEVQQMKQMLLLTMIEKPQAQERIKAVNLTRELPRIDVATTEALIYTLNQDQSINVRLAALEALLPYGDQSAVRQALITSIRLQDSPLVQLALADAMILLQEKTAIEPLNDMLQSNKVDASIQPRIQSTIKSLQSI